jgi:hypothetical protein
MCEAINTPPPELKRIDGSDWDSTYRNYISEYFIKQRSEEWEKKFGKRPDDGKQLT